MQQLRGYNNVTSKYCAQCGHAMPQVKTEPASISVRSDMKRPGINKKKLIGIVAGVASFFVTSYAVEHLFQFNEIL